MGKTPVISANAFGFIGNRIYAAYRAQCEFMLEEGAYPSQIDHALENYGFAMGPFAVGDMSGLDIAWGMRKSQATKRNPAHRYVTIPDSLCMAGRLGRKTNAGYYRYDPHSGARAEDPEVHAVNGYGFPRWQGGPVFVARELGLEKLNTQMDLLEKYSRPGFRRANLQVLFE